MNINEHILIAIVLLVVFVISKSIKVVPEGEEWIIETFGKIKKETLKPGMNFIFPLISRVKEKICIMKQNLCLTVNACNIDNTMLTYDVCISYRITDPAKIINNSEILKDKLISESQIKLREIVESKTWEDTRKNVDEINEELLKEMKYMVMGFGYIVTNVILSDIHLPKDVVDKLKKETDK